MDIDYKNALTRLVDEYQTISGLEVSSGMSGFFELYRDAFLDALADDGIGTDDALVVILERQADYQYVGEFLTEPKEQVRDLAAFGLILFDRMARLGQGPCDPETYFVMHEQLFECYEYVTRGTSAVLRAENVRRARAAADARHSRPGGARDRAEAIRAAWASGKYSSRDICADQEYEALGFGSFAAARKALRNTPDPT